jgi:hypothetical protein
MWQVCNIVEDIFFPSSTGFGKIVTAGVAIIASIIVNSLRKIIVGTGVAVSRSADTCRRAHRSPLTTALSGLDATVCYHVYSKWKGPLFAPLCKPLHCSLNDQQSRVDEADQTRMSVEGLKFHPQHFAENKEPFPGTLKLAAEVSCSGTADWRVPQELATLLILSHYIR